MRSMTGFGKAEVKAPEGVYAIEVNTVNNRFLEFSFKMPRHLAGMEFRIRELTHTHFERGKLMILVNFEPHDEFAGERGFNERAALAYLKQLRAFQKKNKLAGDVSITDLLAIPDVTKGMTRESDEEALWKLLRKAFVSAFESLSQMRAGEGKRLAADISKRLTTIEKSVKKIEKLAQNSVTEYRVKLKERLAQLLESPDINRQRLEEEVALLAERCDTTEEVVRLGAHIAAFRDTMAASSAGGKRLNFLMQEMNREVNTIGSKSLNADIAQGVIGLKEEIEKIREQIQNVE